MIIKDKDTLLTILTLMTMANSSAFLENDSGSGDDFTQVVGDFIEANANQPIFLLMKDKKTKQATKALAESAMSEFIGAVKVKEFRRARLAHSEGVNNITKVSIGQEAYSVIKEELATPCKIIKKPADMEKPEISLMLAAISRHIRKELAVRQIYSGPID
jgi:hypothetical protein